MEITLAMQKSIHIEAPLVIEIQERRSRRAYSDKPIEQDKINSLFEAARWAPSANNSQPWRFIYAKRDSQHWQRFYALLNEKNQLWASNAAVLIVLISKTTHVRKGATEATPLRSHSLDAGAAWASLAFQAEYKGWRTHAIGGFDREKAREVLNIPQGFHVDVAIAVGKQTDLSTLAEEFQQREQPSTRNPLSELVAEGEFLFNPL
jgi:nitroreductase